MISAINGLGSVAPNTSVSKVGTAAPAAGADFGKMLADMASGTVDAMKAGESTAVSGITGGSSVQQVVDAMMSAEQALQTAIAVRDKLIAAYQEISRMTV
jgi:flagellar hook-basal body complex protein FliE